MTPPKLNAVQKESFDWLKYQGAWVTPTKYPEVKKMIKSFDALVSMGFAEIAIVKGDTMYRAKTQKQIVEHFQNHKNV